VCCRCPKSDARGPRSDVRRSFPRLLLDLNTQALDFLIQSGKRHVEAFCGLGLVPIALLQHVQDDVAFAVLHDVKQRCITAVFEQRERGAASHDRIGKKFRADVHSGGEDYRPLDHVLQFTHVARPGVGQQRAISTGNVVPSGGQFFPDSKRLLFDGHEPGHASRLYIAGLDGGQPRPITPEGFSLGTHAHDVSPDGKRIAAVTPDGIVLVSVDGGDPHPVPSSLGNDTPLRWAKDGSTLFVGQRGETSCPVSRLDIQTGTRTAWKTVRPSDIAGVVGVACPRIAADEEHYVFGYVRNLSDLFLVEHLK